MGWIRKKILNMVVQAIKENGVDFGLYRIIERDGNLTIIKK